MQTHDQSPPVRTPHVISPRSEQELLDDLRALCTSRGYAHALAQICLGNDWIRLSRDASPADYSHLYDDDRLTLTEVSTLTVLLASQPLTLTHPGSEVIQQYVESTHALLKELHDSLGEPFLRYGRAVAAAHGDNTPPLPGSVFREPYFYTAPTAYYHQYRDFAVERYRDDDPWLSSKCGFNISECRSVLSSLSELQEQKVNQWQASANPSTLDLLACFSFDMSEVSRASGVAPSTTAAVLARFLCPDHKQIRALTSAHDFNAITARPILASPDGRYLVFQFYWLFESLYVSPAYWMRSDTAYNNIAARNRGAAAETLAKGLMGRVFRREHVHRNVLVTQGNRQVGEIDVLVVFGDRAVAIETKSKGITQES